MAKYGKQARSSDEILTRTRKLIDSDQLTPAQKEEMETRCQRVERLPANERESYDHFLRHMPDGDADLTLIVIKGHLLIEQKIREFVSARMFTREAISKAELTTFQAICLAEALTLPRREPRQFWAILYRLNKLRNEIAHNLEPKGLEDRVKAIVSDYGAQWIIKSGLVGVLAHAYAQLSELCRMGASRGLPSN
jgi:hypothetical protein